MKNYSQNNEQEIILNYFGDFKGRFLDIGAYNGVDLSNTRALLELGWSGVLVEPNPFNLVDLIKNCRGYENRTHIVCGACLGHTFFMTRLRLDGGAGRGWAATVNQNARIDNETADNIAVPIIPLETFWTDFDFISIDAEYFDQAILASLTEVQLRPCRMMVIEAVERDWMREYLQTKGFRIHAETPENIIAAK